MMKAVIVVCFAVLAIAHGATVPARLEVRQDQAPMCGSCVWLVKTLKCEVADPDTQDDFIRILLKDFCPQLPAQAQDSCTQLVPALVPTAIMYLQSLSAKELCADATLCGPVPVTIRRPFTQQQQQDFNYCPMCKMVVIGLKQELKNPENEKAVIERAHEACKDLPTDWREPCAAYVDQLVLQAFAYIETLDPTQICTNFGACLPGQLFVQLPRNVSVPPLPPALVAKAASLRQRAHELSASNDFCDTCKVVITEAATILGNLDTQKQILEYAKEACTTLGPNFQDQCLNYVELYGPLVINMIVQYLKPELCISAGYCPTPSLPLSYSVHGAMRAL